MQNEMNKIFDSTQQELDQENEKSKEIVQSSYQRLLQLKNKDGKPVSPKPAAEKRTNTDDQDSTTDVDKWEIEYEE